VSVPGVPDEELSAAERRLVEHLEIVKASPPQGGQALVRQVVRKARWQRALRQPLQVIGTIAAAVVDSLAGLLGIRRGPRP
jgi:hypothetical protein